MAKSIIDVEVNDGKWKTFIKQVDEHQKKLANMPHQWGAIGKSMIKTSNEGAKIVAKITSMSKALENAKTISGKMNLALKATDRTVTSLGRGAARFTRHIKEATKSIVSWLPVMGIMSGLLGAGGLFGLSKLAAGVSQGSMTAAGAGTSYGGAKASETTYGQIFGGAGGVDSLLNMLARWQGTAEGKAKFAMLGIKPEQYEGKDTASLIAPVMRAIQSRYQQAPKGLGLSVAGKYAPDFDQNTILRITKANIDSLERENAARTKELSLSQGTQNSWMRFQRNLDAAGERLKNIFANVFGGKLLGALTKFQNGLLKAASMLANSPVVKRLIEGAGKGIETGARYLLSDQFPKDIQKFIDTLGEIKDAMVSVAHVLNSLFGGKESTLKRSAIEARGVSDEMERRRKAMESLGVTGKSGELSAINVRHSSAIELNINNAAGFNPVMQARALSSSSYVG